MSNLQQRKQRRILIRMLANIAFIMATTIPLALGFNNPIPTVIGIVLLVCNYVSYLIQSSLFKERD
jgi:hypothetical protein